jgi:hypothetical protein
LEEQLEGVMLAVAAVFSVIFFGCLPPAETFGEKDETLQYELPRMQFVDVVVC